MSYTGMGDVSSSDWKNVGGGTITIAAPGLRVAMSAATKAITMVATWTGNIAMERSAVVGIMRPPLIPANPTISQLPVSDPFGVGVARLAFGPRVAPECILRYYSVALGRLVGLRPLVDGDTPVWVYVVGAPHSRPLAAGRGRSAERPRHGAGRGARPAVLVCNPLYEALGWLAAASFDNLYHPVPPSGSDPRRTHRNRRGAVRR